MGRRSVSKRPKRKHSELKEPCEMLSGAKPLSNNNSWAEDGQRKSPKMNRLHRKGALRKQLGEVLKRTTKPLRRNILTEEGLAKSFKKQHSKNTNKWHLCKAGSFSYGESPRTPPLEGTSLHWWNNSVERPWGILSLFTTCLRLCEITLPQSVTCGLHPKSTLRREKH